MVRSLIGRDLSRAMELTGRQLKRPRKVSTDQTAHHCALHVKGEVVGTFVDLVTAKRRLIAAYRIPRRPGFTASLRLTIHDLDRHVAVAGKDQHPGAVSFADSSVGIRLFKRSQPPSSN